MAEVIDTPSDGDDSDCNDTVGITTPTMTMMTTRMPGVVVKMVTVPVVRTGKKLQCDKEEVFLVALLL